MVLVTVSLSPLTDIMEQGGTLSKLPVAADFSGKHARNLSHFLGVHKHALTIASPKIQTTDSARALLAHAVYSKLKQRLLAFLVNLLLNLTGDLLHNLLNARRMNASVSNKALKRLLGNFLAHRVKAGDNDGLGRIVNDDVNTGQGLKGAGIASLAAYDTAFHLVTRQRNRSNRIVAGNLRRNALHGGNEHFLSLLFCCKLSFLVDFVQQGLGIMAGIIFQTFYDKSFGFFRRQAGNPLKLSPKVLFRNGKSFLFSDHSGLALGKFLVPLVSLLVSLIQEFLFLRHTIFVSLYFFTAIAVLPFLLGSILNELFFCLKLNLFFKSFSFLYGILSNAFGFLFGRGKLKSGINPANSPSKNNSRNGENDVRQNCHTVSPDCFRIILI